MFIKGSTHSRERERTHTAERESAHTQQREERREREWMEHIQWWHTAAAHILYSRAGGCILYIVVAIIYTVILLY